MTGESSAAIRRKQTRSHVMKDALAVLVLLMLPALSFAQSEGHYRGPIIDMHMHGYTAEDFWGPAPNPATRQPSVQTPEEHMERSIEIMKEHNVVLGVVSGTTLAAAQQWAAHAPDLILKGITFGNPAEFLDTLAFSELIEGNSIDVLGEVGAQYAGVLPFGPDDLAGGNRNVDRPHRVS